MMDVPSSTKRDAAANTIAQIGVLATAEPRHGGTLPYTLSMIAALKQLPPTRYQFTIFTTADNHEYDRCGLPIARLAGARALTLGGLTGRDPFAAVDKIIAPIYSTVLLMTRRPFAFTLHDLQEKYYPEHFTRATRVWRHTTNRLLTGRASRILCESHFVERDIIRHFGVPPSRIAVVPAPPISELGGHDVKTLPFADVRAKFDLPETYVFYPAQFWPHKNHRRLVEAFARLTDTHPDCGLVLTGRANGQYDTVVKRAQDLGIHSKIRFLGYVELAELAAVYRGATVVAIPTLFESISLPVYEAFSLGAAVCASNVVALPEQIGDAGLLFDPLSVDDIAAKICDLLANPTLRHQLIERGTQRMSRISRNDYTERLGAVLDQLEQ